MSCNNSEEKPTWQDAQPQAKGFIVLKENQHGTYVVYDNFDYYVKMEAKSSMKFVSKHGNPININFNIWTSNGESPNVAFLCDVGAKINFGVAATSEQLSGLQECTYNVYCTNGKKTNQLQPDRLEFEEIIPATKPAVCLSHPQYPKSKNTRLVSSF